MDIDISWMDKLKKRDIEREKINQLSIYRMGAYCHVYMFLFFFLFSLKSMYVYVVLIYLFNEYEGGKAKGRKNEKHGKEKRLAIANR